MEYFLMDEQHVDAAANLSYGAYLNELAVVDSLPKEEFLEVIKANLRHIITNKLGVVAIENKQLMGFLAGYGPISEFFGKNQGIFVPIEGHGAIDNNSEYIYTSLYREAAKYWASKGIFSHGIALYSHNEKLINNMFVNGFGMRCVDAMTSLKQNPLTFLSVKDSQIKPKVSFAEVGFDEIESIYSLRVKLEDHINESPIFFPARSGSLDDFRKQRLEKGSRFFVCKENDIIIAYCEITSEGENFASSCNQVINICGAYIEEEFRGSNIFTKLLGFTFDKIRETDISICGVDFESINPEAYGFWTKHFTPYTNSLVRRVDERSIVESYELREQI